MGTNTGLGIGIGIPFKNNALGGDKPYFPPELKARMIGVWTNYGKKNTDADRNIIKNKIPNAGGDLEILNAAYKLNSGFGEYNEDFTTWIKSSKITSVNSESFDFVSDANFNLLYYKSNIGKDIPSFKVRIKLKGEGKVFYNYITSEGVFTNKVITSEEYVVPISYNTKYTGETPVNCGFTIGVTSEECSGTITQIPNFEDAFVTDGINDIIASIKTLEEWNIGNKGITIVSMIHQINTNTDNFITTNNIRTDNKVIGRNIVSNIEKTGIYGWYKENIQSDTINVINNILGDKNDYTSHSSSSTNINPINNSKFYVQGYAAENGFNEISSIAHYWTFAVLGKATEDEINLIIGNYNLDRSLKPDILCNIGKQGITNDNHADFNDKLIDYSGNGRDIQMNNLAWKGGSGIAAKPFETIKDYAILSDEARQKLTIYNEFSYKVKSNTPNHYWVVQSIIKDNTSYQVTIITDKDCYWINSTSFINNEGNKETIRKEYLIKANTPTQVTICGLNEFEYPEDIKPTTAVSYVNLTHAGEVTVTFIPSCKGGLLLDGVNDFGKVTGMPIYKDYTVVTDREIFANIGAISSKNNPGAFVETAGNSVYSFGQATSGLNFISTRSISYLSKYSYCGQSITAGAAEDGTDMWLGTIRDNDSRFFNGAIYSLMSFPYSMSEFLIERQLKKHKLGTLYPNMVEFRPVIKANANYKITYYQIDSTNTWKSIKVGDYIVIGAKLAFQITFDNDASELKEVVSPQLSGIIVEKRPSNSGYNIYSYITSKSPQKINITIDEYIRYEDIVQPYPALLRFNDENGNEVSWGGKFKVGSTITRIGSAADSNLLPNIYNIFGLLLNGNQVTSSKVIVEKTMVFKAKSAYIFDNNEPKCILSPRLLRIPNSSYKILGHIPDISGHGNHGKINNSAYKLNSGVNGYLVDFTTLKDDGIKGIVRTDSKIYLDKSFNYNQGFWLGRTNNPSPAYKVKVSGIPETGMLTYTGGVWLNLVNGINELPARTNTEEEHGFVIQSPNLDWSNLVIEQIGEYEGAYCLDGVDDFVTIPTTVGGKQMLMKANWNSLNHVLYDQRNNAEAPFCIVTASGTIAYNQRNVGGNTYIDGILNNHILVDDLQAITHNIVLNNDYNVANSNSFIGTNYTKSIYAKMSLYDFMLFDEISTDDKIKELNEYVGIEAKVELPPYYWDTYGKTNSDADRDTIQQRGVAVGDYDLINYNHAYEGMSGYNGYPVVFGANKTWETLSSAYGYISDVTSTTIHITMVKNAGTGLLFSYVKKDGALTNIKEIPAFRVTVKGLEGNSKFGYRYLATEDATKETLVYLGNGTHELAKSFAPTEALLDLTSNAWVGIFITSMVEGELVFDCDITIEILPEYENGLVYDAITDYSKNANIPALDDFTAIIKREWLKKQGCPLIKGSKVYEGGNGNALLLEWDKAYNFVFYKRTDIMEGELPDNISFITPTNYNGNVITRGSEQDTNGICIAGDGNAGFANMVFYKLILYPKTIPLLQINFLKNLMERDEIIDLNNPIFIKNE